MKTGVIKADPAGGISGRDAALTLRLTKRMGCMTIALRLAVFQAQACVVAKANFISARDYY